MKKILLLIAVIAITSVKAQITVDNTQTPTQWVQGLFLGSAVTVSNVTYTGAAQATGAFTDTANSIGFGGGVLLTTGSIQNAIGPNNSGNISVDNSLPGDPDIDLIMNPTTSNDASVLEFDFVPVGDTVIFQYSFASDEYME